MTFIRRKDEEIDKGIDGAVWGRGKLREKNKEESEKYRVWDLKLKDNKERPDDYSREMPLKP